MGKAVSRATQALGFGGDKKTDTDEIPEEARPPQWDTTIDQLFGDAPPDNSLIAPSAPLAFDDEPPPRPKRRRAPPPPPPSRRHGGGRGFPTSPAAGRRRSRRNGVQPMRTPIIPDRPRRLAKQRMIAINTPSGNPRKPRSPAVRVIEREAPAKVVLSHSVRRQPSIRLRHRNPSQRSQRLQELLQCPVCFNPYTEPRLLPCGHTYCHDCLNRLMQNEHDVVTCPECRKQHLVPEDGAFPPNFIVRNLIEQGSLDTDRFTRRSNHHATQNILFYIAVRKISRNHSQVKRLTIEMPMGNYLQDTCETLIRRIAEREQIPSIPGQLVLEFGDKRLRPQRTLASYGVQNGDLLFLLDPDQRLSFLAYEDEANPSSSFPTLPSRNRVRNASSTSSVSDIRTATSNDMNYNRLNTTLSPISSVYDDDNDDRHS